MRGFLLALMGLALAAGAVLGPRAFEQVLPRSGSVPGLEIEGVQLEAGTDIGAHVEERARRFAERRIELRLPGRRTTEQAFGELGLRIDVESAVRRAEHVGREGRWATRLDELRRARSGKIDVPLDVVLDFGVLAAELRALKEDFDSTAVPARLDLDAGRVVPHVPAKHLDIHRAAEIVLEAARVEAKVVVLPVAEIAPRVSAELVASIDRSEVVAEFKTFFGRGGGRAGNIEQAAKKLDGVVLAAGEVVSFNEIVGARTEENGFFKAPEIYKGEMVQGVGGGTCQVASTLHAAAFFGGLDVVERYPHSRPSGYIRMGLDATVSWPTVDLRLRNPWPFPVVIDTHVEGPRIDVRLLGARRPANVTYQSATVGVIPFKRKITEAHWLAPGRIIKKQKGIRGYRIRRHRRILTTGGEERIETSVDHYPATPEHFIVPPGTDPEGELPPLPEDASAASDTRPT